MNTFNISFVANDGKAYKSDSKVGKRLGYITWTPSLLRINFNTVDLNIVNEISLEQKCIKSLKIESWKRDDGTFSDGAKEFFERYSEPKVKFYSKPNLLNEINSVKVTSDDLRKGYVDIYVAGDFQEGKLYGGASPEQKDIKIIARSGISEASVKTMIRVRRNANELTTKAKQAYLKALSEINERDNEGNAIGIYSTDFFAMHVKGSKSIAHGTEVFLPWHRLYILDLERQLQLKDPNVTLHYWKFDEAAPNIFKQDFMGESVIDFDAISIQGLSLNFAKFDDANPLKKWTINNEKLIRRVAKFNYKQDSAGFDGISVLSEYDTLLNKTHLRKNILDKDGEIVSDDFSISLMEDNPHGYTHVSHVGYINYVPTAPKDPIFFFLHSNVERLYTKWQNMNGLYDLNSTNVYENLDPKIKWKDKDSLLWPWSGKPTPNDFHLDPPGTRANNFTKANLGKVFKENSPSIEDALDAFGIYDFNNYLGFGYDDCNTVVADDIKFSSTQNIKHEINIATPASKSIVQILNDLKEISNFGTTDSKLLINKKKSLEKVTLKSTINDFVLKSISSSQLKSNAPQISSQFEQVLGVSDDIETRDSIINTLVLKENRDIIHQIEQNYFKLKLNLKNENLIKYYDEKVDENITASYSKYLTFYLLSLYDFNLITDSDRIEVIKNNIEYFKNIENEEVLDVKIVLYSFASYSTLKNEIIPLFFTNDDDLTFYLSNLEKKSNELIQVNESKANKYWALLTLLTNAGIGVKK